MAVKRKAKAAGEAMSTECPPPVLYHYTDWAGLEGIVRTGALWATHHAALNDREEIGYAKALLLEIANEHDRSGPTSPRSMFEEAHRILRKADDIMQGWCIVSLTEEADLLSQWRAYARQGRGFCIGFPATNRQMYSSKLPNSFCTARNAFAF